MKAFLILEDGTVFEGKHIGADKDVVSEIVFNTSMTGYTEVFTDPSYAGQAVCMTYPLIGNYGVCLEDMESEKIWPDAVIVREMARVPSNFRCDMSLQEFLEKYETPGIEGIDTRKLVRILREKGTMNGYITTNENVTYDSIKDKLHAYTTGDVVSKVSCKEKVRLTAPNPRGEKIPKIAKEENGKGLKVALLDVGAKRNIADALLARGCGVTI